MYHYPFPIITSISDVLSAIKDRKEFFVHNAGDYLVINYQVALVDSFPEVSTRSAAVLRECRGLIFDARGDIIARRYHKFFNVNEREETHVSKINLAEGHSVLEKIDGSMISPFKINNELIWGTKMGVTDISRLAFEFVKDRKNYLALAEYLVENNLTPIFEWVSKQSQIVMLYETENLILTAIRGNISGEYLSFEELQNLQTEFDIPLVKFYDSISNLKEFLKASQEEENIEGYVIRFNDGHMLKVKSDWYLQLHKAKSLFAFEKNIWSILLQNKLDDLLPILEDSVRIKILNFSRQLEEALRRLTTRLVEIARDNYKSLNGSKKRFALEVVNSEYSTLEKAVLFKIYDQVDSEREVLAESFIRDFCLKYCSNSTKLESLKNILGVSYD